MVPMANTFSQIYIQTVFAVSNRLSLITPAFKEDLYKYISGIVTKQGQKMISVNSMPDHIHILIGLRPSMALADLVRESQSRLFKFRQQEQMGSWKIQLARRLRRFLLWPLSIKHRDPLYSESRKAPQATVVQEGVFDPATKIRNHF